MPSTYELLSSLKHQQRLWNQSVTDISVGSSLKRYQFLSYTPLKPNGQP